MKNFGFTLTEVLITLGIIGVIAALTTPALVKNSGNAKVGPSLAKFVNTFETASHNFMMDQGANKLSSALADAKQKGDAHNDSYLNMDSLMEELSKYMYVVPVTIKSYSSYLNGNLMGTSTNKTYYQTKEGFLINITSWYPGTIDNPVWGPYKGPIGTIDIDINGVKGNNNWGREIFLFMIDDSGSLIPFGGNVYKKFSSHFAAKNLTCSFVKDFDKSKYENPGSNQEFIDTFESAQMCTGAIADNGWVMDY